MGYNKPMTLNEAFDQGLTRLRNPKWADPCSHVEFIILAASPLRSSTYAFWTQFWGPVENAVLGNDEDFMEAPITYWQDGDDYWAKYEGPLPGEEGWPTPESLQELRDAGRRDRS